MHALKDDFICIKCMQLREYLITTLRNDMTIDFHSWYSSWMESLDDVEFMKEFFMNKTMISRIPRNNSLEIKKHFEKYHDIKLG